MTPLAVTYIAGCVFVLLTAEEPLPARLALALVWPVPAAIFAMTLVALVLALPLARPILGGVLLATLGLGAWLVSRAWLGG